MTKTNHEKVIRLVTLAFLIALVAVLQIWGSGIKIGTTSFNLVLIPIAVGAMLLGPTAGAILGFECGLITLLSGILGVDPFTNILFINAPVGTVLICIGKGTLSGFGAGWVYRLVVPKNSLAASFAAAASAPLINTGIFAIGSFFLRQVFEKNFINEGVSFFFFLFITCIGINFLVEFGVNLIVAPALHRIVEAVKKEINHTKR